MFVIAKVELLGTDVNTVRYIHFIFPFLCLFYFSFLFQLVFLLFLLVPVIGIPFLQNIRNIGIQESLSHYVFILFFSVIYSLLLYHTEAQSVGTIFVSTLKKKTEKLKADRPHPRNYPPTPNDYRHTLSPSLRGR